VLHDQLRTGASVCEIVDAHRQDGSSIACEFSAQPEFSHGRFQGAVCVILDLSLRVHAQLALRESEWRFRELLMDLPLPAVITDRYERVVFCNRALATLAGYNSPAEVEGRRWDESFGTFPEDAQFWMTFYAGRIIDHYDGRVLAADGAVYEVAWSNVAIKDIGDVALAASIGHDVTEQRATQRALAEAEAQSRELVSQILSAEQAERARVSEALHDDTVQVLTASLIALDQIAARSATQDDREFVQRARATLAAATERTRLLMFELRPAMLESSGLRGALSALCEHAAERGEFAVEVDAPAARYSAGTEELAYRTISEAVMNATRHSQARNLRVTVSERDGMLDGSICDDGVGFVVGAPSHARRERLHMGMLAMAERVRLAGGTVTVDSTPGHGTSVRFVLPITAR
jgi:PAS domain S-box-containing protein